MSRTNPCNIVDAKGVRWLGSVPSDSRFVQFVNCFYGYRAALRVLYSYMAKHHIRSIRGIISRWAPPFENDTERYIRFVSSVLGVDPTYEVSSTEDLVIILAAMTVMENTPKTLHFIRDFLSTHLELDSVSLEFSVSPILNRIGDFLKEDSPLHYTRFFSLLLDTLSKLIESHV